MKNFILAGVAAIGIAAAPQIAIAAQDDMMQPGANAFPMDQQQQQMFMDWPDDQRIAYTQWDPAIQEYYWDLQPMQQQAWWALTDDQRDRLFAMNPQQRDVAWQAIDRQMREQMGNMPDASMPNANMANNTSAMARSTTAMNRAGVNINYVSNATVQNIPPAHQGQYPLCNAGRTDNCINPREASRR